MKTQILKFEETSWCAWKEAQVEAGESVKTRLQARQDQDTKVLRNSSRTMSPNLVGVNRRTR
jgi:hypothetical protein